MNKLVILFQKLEKEHTLMQILVVFLKSIVHLLNIFQIFTNLQIIMEFNTAFI